MKTQITKQHTEVVPVQPITSHQKDGMKKRNLRKFWIPTVMALALSLSAFGAEADIVVSVQSLSIIDTTTGGHYYPGDMEIGVLHNFVIPPGFTCTDSHNLTTRKTTDPDRAMFNLLLKAKTTPPFTGEPLTMQVRITDNPSLAAYPGRCSIEYVTVN